MDEELKRRLIGVAIVSVLMIGIVPYFFEDKTVQKAEGLPDAMTPQPLALPEAVEPSGDAVSEREEPEAREPQAPVVAKKRKYEMVPLTDEVPNKAQRAESTLPNEMPAASEADADESEPPLKPIPHDASAFVPAPGVATRKVKPTPVTAAPTLENHPAPVTKPKSSTSVARDKPAAKKVEPSQAGRTSTHTAESGSKTTNKSASVVPDPVKKPAVSPNPSSSASHPSGYIVQAGTFSDENNARNLAEKIKKRNLPVRIQPIDTSNGKIYRVTVGSSFDHQKAEQVQKQLSEQDGVKGLILQTR